MNSETKEIEVQDGQDISGCCIKCGNANVIKRETVKVEYAPFWAMYLRATGALSFIYNMVVKRASLRVGFCAKHAQSGIGKRLVAYPTLIIACCALGIGVLENLLYLQLIGVCILIVFLQLIRVGTPVRVKKINGTTIILSNKMHVHS